MFDFDVTTASSGAVTWSVTNPDDSATDRATIVPATGVLTASKGVGSVQVTATVAADNVYAAGSVSHTLTLNRLASDLALSGSPPATLDANAMFDFDVTTASSGAVTWSVTDADGSATDGATIVAGTGVLTASKGVGRVQVTAMVAADDVYAAGSVSHTLTLNRLASDLAFSGSPPAHLDVNASHTFTATKSNSGEIIWGVIAADGSATDHAMIDEDSGALTALKGGAVQVVATVEEDDVYTAGRITHTVTLDRLASDLAFSGSPPANLDVNASHTFTVTHSGSGAVTWSVTNPDDSATDRAMIDADSGVLTALKGGMVSVVATVAEGDAYAAGTVSHMLTLDRLTSDLAISNFNTDIPRDGGAITITATTISGGTISFSISDSTRATLVDNGDGTATLTPVAAGTTQITASVTPTDTHEAGVVRIDVTVNTLDDPNLRFSATPPATLPVDSSAQTFTAATDGSTAITWSVVAPGGEATLVDNSDGTATLTLVSAGMVEVIATVAADTTWSTDTIRHTLEITPLANTLTFTSPVASVEVGESATFVATHSGSTAITWSVTDTDDSATVLAQIDPDSGELTAIQSGMVKVVATVAEDGTYATATDSHTVTITRLPANLRFISAPARLHLGKAARFSVLREGSGAITWGLTRTGGDPAATIDGQGLVIADTAANETVTVEATVAETGTHATQTISTMLEIDDFEFDVDDYADFDGDGLIEIYDLTMLHNMRHDLAGTSYKSSADADGVTLGCPDSGCYGYELVSNLDFDKDGDGRSWSVDGSGYALDEGDHAEPYFLVNSGGSGWLPIGRGSNPFTATLEGNGFVIRNLAVRTQEFFTHVGLIGYSNGAIRNLGLEQALVTNAAFMNAVTRANIAPLAGELGSNGSVTASYATGVADGGNDNTHILGGLVGLGAGDIIASYATTEVNGGGGPRSQTVGGLVGHGPKAPSSPAMPRVQRVAGGGVILWVAWWAFSWVATSLPAMPPAQWMAGRRMTTWAAWWVRVAALSPPATPPVPWMAGRGRMLWAC